MRFVAAQFLALLADDLWLRSAAAANDAAQRLYAGASSIYGLDAGPAPVVNSLFPVLPRETISALQEWCFFWDWDVTTGQVRWMTAWDTTPEDVDAFVALLGRALTSV